MIDEGVTIARHIRKTTDSLELIALAHSLGKSEPYGCYRSGVTKTSRL